MPTVLMLTQCTEAGKVRQAIMHALNSSRGLLILTVTSRPTDVHYAYKSREFHWPMCYTLNYCYIVCLLT